MPLDKPLVLRHRLAELLRQNIITPVSEGVPFTSAMVLVSKWNEPKLNPNKITCGKSLSSHRLVSIFATLTMLSQTEDFRHVIPDLQELVCGTGSQFHNIG